MTTDSVTILPPAHALTGKVSPPGSKSITNRALLLAGLAKGTSRLTGALKSDDTRYMAEALRQMGVTVEEPDATTFVVTSSGELKAPSAPLFLGNAGTATRFLTAALALGHGRYVVDGDEHMRKRPIKPLVEALQSLGVAIAAPSGCPPVAIDANGAFKKNHVVIDAGLSSQYVSALQMAAACGSEPFTIELAGADIGARGYIDLTMSAMRAWASRDRRRTLRPNRTMGATTSATMPRSAACAAWPRNITKGPCISHAAATLAINSSRLSSEKKRRHPMRSSPAYSP